ncbi:MAG: glycosyl hydrolase family 28-related protein [Aquabacterium sp.]
MATRLNTGTHGTGSRTFLRDAGAIPPGDQPASWIDVRDEGAAGNGSNDDTVQIQAALTAGAAAGLPVYLPAGTWLVSALTWPSGLPALFGDGNDLSILKRRGSAASTASILTATSRSDFSIADIGFDGNKANQTLGSNNLTLSACSDFQLRRLRSFGAKAASGYGGGIILSLIPSTNPAGREVAIKDCEAYDNDGDGLNLQRTGAGISIDGGDYSDNTANGIYFYDQAITPAADTVPNMRISNVRAERNGGGIAVLGFFVAGIASVRTEGHGSDPVHGLIVTGCQVNENDGYGIFVQATGTTIIGNTARGNGSTTHAGICANAERVSIIGNILDNNIYWGIDFGGSRYGTVAHNQISDNSGIGINLGACEHVSCTDNLLINNGIAAIGVSRNDSGSFYFPWDTVGLDIARNRIIETRSSSNFGILMTGLPDDTRILDNVFVWPDTTANNAIRGGITSGRIQGNRLVGNTVGEAFLMNTAATITFPDWADALAFNSDTAAITVLQSYSQSVGSGTLTAAKLTARGTGYTADFNVPVTGGGGAGATVVAKVSRDGRIAALVITAAGSGYSGTPTLDLSAGSGSGATAVAVVGVPLVNGKQLALLAHGSQFRITDGAIIQTPSAAGATITVANQGALSLRAWQSAWCPVGFAAPAGTLYPTVLNIGGTTHQAGTGTPEGVVTATIGSSFFRTDGGVGTTHYKKTSGSGSTGWTAS